MNLTFASGFITGLPSAFLVTPIDHTRIQMQKKDGSIYKNSIQAGREITKKYGIKGLYLGFFPTILREVIALSFYFGIY
jgi:hypothetical protein